MRNPSRKLVLGTDPEYGVRGFRPAEHSDFNYLDGMGVAHDLLEHFPSDKGTIEDEFMALGAMLYVRGDDYFAQKGNRYSALENMASDFPNLFRYAQGGQFGHMIAHKTPKPRGIDEFDENEFKTHIARLKSEFDDEEEQEAFMAFSYSAIPWIIKGYKKAEVRYRKLTRWELLSAFLTIEKDVNGAMKRIDNYWGETDNVDIKLKYDLNNLTVDVFFKHPEESRWTNVLDI